MMIKLDYQKRKNRELFSSFEKNETINLLNAQNYIPIYKKFFSLNESNFNAVNLNNKWYINDLHENIEDNKNLFECTLKSIEDSAGKSQTKKKPVFFKMAPLLDPFKFMVGKYNVNDEHLFSLPSILPDLNTAVNPKILGENNSAYVDGFFSFLTSKLLHEHGFMHGVDYYGSFLAHKNNFTVDVIDDLEYLVKSEFFIKTKNVLFQIEEYDHLIEDDKVRLKPIKIHGNNTRHSSISAKSINNEIFENIFSVEDLNNSADVNKNSSVTEKKAPEVSVLTFENLKEHELSLEVVDVSLPVGNTEEEKEKDKEKDKESNGSGENAGKTITTIKSSSNSGSTCSSRTSHTNSNDEVDSGSDDESRNGQNECNACDAEDYHVNIVYIDGQNENDDDEETEYTDDDEDEGEDEEDEDSSSCEEESVYATIPKFPVQVICMEYCENTMDSLLMENELSQDEWFSALIQIVMMLITYQKAFSFTHNDLHTNNVMYSTTEKKYLYYCYKKKYYKVPTFGRIFKIIDFGRGAYKFNGQLFFSDSFHPNGDASTQYNTEPYFNEKKPRLETNCSFDLCRLACSIFDFLVEDVDEVKDINSCSPIVKLIVDWCTDDNGINVLYKNTGVERYPGFKLYKMIARCVHKHTPQAQLERAVFKKFIVDKSKLGKNDKVMNIDDIPSYV